VATAFWLMEQEHITPKVAEEALTMKYGFFKFERFYVTLMRHRETVDKIFWDLDTKHPNEKIDIHQWLKEYSQFS